MPNGDWWGARKCCRKFKIGITLRWNAAMMVAEYLKPIIRISLQGAKFMCLRLASWGLETSYGDVDLGRQLNRYLIHCFIVISWTPKVQIYCYFTWSISIFVQENGVEYSLIFLKMAPLALEHSSWWPQWQWNNSKIPSNLWHKSHLSTCR